MSQSLVLLLLLLFFCLFVGAGVFLDKAAKRHGVTRWMFFGRWVLFYGVIALYLGFICAGVGRNAVSRELLLKGALFSCSFAAVLGLVHGGVKSLPVVWVRFVKVTLFCGMMGVILYLFAVGISDMNSVRGMFLKVLVLALLLKLLLGFFIRAQSDTLVQRVLRVLNFVLFICILSLVFNFAQWGAERLGWSWLWFLNEKETPSIGVFLVVLIYHYIQNVCRDVGSFFKKK